MTRWKWLMARLQEWFAHPWGRPRPAEGPPRVLSCREVVELVLSYLEDSLDPGERQILEAHIADCPGCWRFLQSYRETVALGQQLREEAIPPDVRERLESFLRSRLPRTS